MITRTPHLSGIGKSTEINLGYLRRYSLEEKSNWFIIYFHPAEKGKHKVLLSGTIKVPNSADLNGEPFVVEASIKALDEIGAVREVASDEIIYEIVDTE